MFSARLGSVLTLLVLSASPGWAGESRVLGVKAVSGEQGQRAAYESAAREKRHEAMEMLEGLMRGLSASDPRRPEMMFRLGEMYADEAEDLELAEMAGAIDQPGVASNAQSQRWYERSARMLTQLRDDYPDYQRGDEATRALADTLTSLKRLDEAQRLRLELVHRWPQSPLAAQTYVLIGEHLFEGGDAFKAGLAYQKSLSYQDERWTPFALYKLAWCQHNLGQEQERIDTMIQAVVASTPAPGQSDQGRINLRDEAIKDLVGFLAESGDVDQARRILTKLGRADQIPTMLARLGELQFENGRFDEAMRTWSTLLAEDPDGPAAPGVHARIYDALRKQARYEDALANLELRLSRFGPGTAWARANPERAAETVELLERDLRAFAVLTHQSRAKTTAAAYKRFTELASRAYPLYLASFAEDSHAYDVRYAYAELLYTSRRYEEAYDQYMAVVALDPKGEHAKFCAESAIFAAEKMGAEQPAPMSGLSAADEALLKAGDQYIALFGGPKTKAIAYKMAYRLYERQQLQEASLRFQQVIRLDPGAPEAEQAANLILDSFVLVSDYDHLVEVARAFRDQPDLGGPQFKRDVARIYENARLKQIETTLSAATEHRRAGDAFLAFYEEFPASENADLALHNAGVRYQQARETSMSMKARETLLARFPSSRFAADDLAALAWQAEELADFPRAAALYEQLYQRAPQHAAAREAIWSAALFRKVMGDWRASVADYRAFLQSFPDDARVPETRLALARVLDDNAQWSEAAQTWSSFFQAPPSGATADQLMFARVRYGHDLERLAAPAERQARHWDETLAFFEAARARGAEMSEGPDLAAEVLFQRLEPGLARYAAMEIGAGTLPTRDQGEALRRAFSAKLAAMQELERGMESVVATGSGEWGLRATVALGQVYENMAATLRRSPAPAGLSEEQLALYRDGIEQRAYAMEQKAISAYDLCLSRSFQLELYNDTTTAALARLRNLDGERFSPLEERIEVARFTAGGARSRGFQEEP